MPPQADPASRRAPWPLCVAGAFWRLSGVLLGLLAAWRLYGTEHVREFQAGPPSGLGERLLAFSVAVAVESLGFALLALLLALWALPLAPLLFRGRPRAEARAGALGVLAGGLALWAWRGTYFAGEWLPFLAPLELIGLNLLGTALWSLPPALVALVLARLAPRRSATAIGWSAGLCWLAGGATALARLTRHPAGPTSTGALLEAAAALALALFVAVLAAWPFISRPQAPRAPRWRPARRVVDGLLLAILALTPLSLWLESRREQPTLALRAPAAGGDNGATAEAPNLVYIVVDTLRADALSCYGYPRPTSPRLDALAAQGALFEDLMASAAWTKPTTGTLLTGLYPSRHGALHHGSMLRLPSGQRTLAEAFQSAGWHTAAIVTNPNIQAVFDFDRGFDTYFDSPVVDTLPKAALRTAWFGRLLIALTRYQFNWNYANDNQEVNRRALPWLAANQDRRFLLYLHYIDPHSPYAPPGEYRRRFAQSHGLVLHNQRKAKVGRDLYDGEVAYQDMGLGQVFDELERLGLTDRTLVAITADHGEEWFEFGSLGHGQSLSQPLVHVPLILAGPGVPPGQRVAAPVETVGLPATLLELCGLLESGARFGDGQSFAGLLRGQPDAGAPLFLENEFSMEHDIKDDFVLSGVRQGELKLVLTEKSIYRAEAGDILPMYELFDLARDPGERQDRFDETGLAQRRDELMRALEAHARFLAEEGLRDQPPGLLTDEMRRQLEALGYLGGK
jgi:arylsulfatase A-like enzyme